MPKTNSHYLGVLVRLARRQGLDVDRLLAEVGVSGEVARADNDWIDNSYLTELVKRLWQETGDEILGIDEQPMRMGSWALVCDYMLAAENLGDLFRRGQRICSYLPPESMGLDFSLGEQSAVVGEVNQNAIRISEIAGRNAQGAADTVSAAENIGSQLNELVKLAGSFRLSLKDATFDFASARSAHLAWVDRVEAHLEGKDAIDEDELVSHHHCVLGNWYYGSGLANYGHIEAMRQMEEPHARLHRTIHECLQLKRKGDHAAAQEKLTMLEGLSRQIVALLNQVEEEISKG